MNLMTFERNADPYIMQRLPMLAQMEEVLRQLAPLFERVSKANEFPELTAVDETIIFQHSTEISTRIRAILAQIDEQPKPKPKTAWFCQACADCGMRHCSDPINCGGMKEVLLEFPAKD